MTASRVNTPSATIFSLFIILRSSHTSKSVGKYGSPIAFTKKWLNTSAPFPDSLKKLPSNANPSIRE